MITRIWHGRTRSEQADRYLQFLIETAVADYKSVCGNLGVEIWRGIEGDICHFWTVTKWDSIESIRNFAGGDIGKAKYYDEDRQFLLEFEPTVQHYETYVF